MSCLISDDLIDPEVVNSMLLCMIKLNHSHSKTHTDFLPLILIKTITANYLPIFYLKIQLREVAPSQQKKERKDSRN